MMWHKTGGVVHARQLAEQAHAGQTDKAGLPYITHPARVVQRLGCADEATRVVAWLHDVVEDTSITLEDLLAAGFSPEVVAAIDAISKRPGESLRDYCARVAANSVARRVKKADLADNTDPARMDYLDRETQIRLSAKYAEVRFLLADFAVGAPGAGV